MKLSNTCFRFYRQNKTSSDVQWEAEQKEVTNWLRYILKAVDLYNEKGFVEFSINRKKIQWIQEI